MLDTSLPSAVAESESGGFDNREVDSRSTDELEEEIAELCVHIDAATYRLLRAIAEFDRREAWPVGFQSTAHWLTWRVGIDRVTAREKVRVARALEGLILALMNLQEPEREEEDEPDPEPQSAAPSRNGSFTTGVLSVQEDRKIALFFTGRKHAGENLADLLQQREAQRAPPIQMCDALSRNLPKSFQTVLANCMSHARRNFLDLAGSFPDEVHYVIETLGKVYRNDEIAQERNLSAAERLAFHQTESGPVMEGLRQWLAEQLEKKRVEPSSGLGKAIAYMQKHWEALTLFLKVESAPLHNNLCEQVLKRAVLNRKNALFFKTERGARVGDLFMSLIHTCNLAGTNPFEYLTTLQLNVADVRASPQRWMPWNHTERLPPNTS